MQEVLGCKDLGPLLEEAAERLADDVALLAGIGDALERVGEPLARGRHRAAQ